GPQGSEVGVWGRRGCHTPGTRHLERGFGPWYGILSRLSGGRVLVPAPPLRRPEVDAAHDHRQVGRRCRHLSGLGGRQGETPACQPPEVEGKAVPLPGQDLQSVSAAVAEDEQVTAERVPAQVSGHDGGQPVDALAPVLRLEADPDPPGQPEGQHGAPPRATTSRATAAVSAPIGTRTISPLGKTTSAGGSRTTRTGANVGVGACGAVGSRPWAVSRL